MMERHRAAGVTASPALVARDVIASQRIEGIDARSHLDWPRPTQSDSTRVTQSEASSNSNARFPA